MIKEIRIGDEVRCDRAILLDDRVRVRRDGCWIDLMPPDGFDKLLLQRFAARAAEIEKLRAALAPFAKLADENRYARWRGIIPGANVKAKDAEAAADALNG